MKNLFTTTAMVLALGLPTLGFAQTTPAETVPMAATDMPAVTGFLAARGLTDLLATDLIGHVVHARRVAADMSATGTAMPSLTATDLEAMDNVGRINDLVLSADGKVQALVIGVGGFLGVGEQDVAVTMDQVSFATDAANRDAVFIIVNTTGELLKSSPPFDRTAATDAMTDQGSSDGVTAAAPKTDREMLTAPELDRDGYTRVLAGDVSVDLLIGKTVYGADDSIVGKVDDVIMDDAGAVKDIIIDFGGFLGMGTTQVALSFDEVTILTNDGNADIRVYVAVTKDQVKAMPVYAPMN